MKVLFVYPNVHNASRINLGIAYLSACLKKAGHQVKLFDTTFYRIKGQLSDDELREKNLQITGPDLSQYGVHYKSDHALLEDFHALIREYNPDILALGCVDATYFSGRSLIKTIRDKKIFTIVGGPRVTADPDSIIEEDWVDAVCIGEGEYAMVELCNRMDMGSDISNIKNIWIKSDRTIMRNSQGPLADLNTLPIPDWDVYNQMHLIRPFAGKVYKMGCFDMSRGCPYKCTYCANELFANLGDEKSKKFFRQKRPETIINEIKWQVNKYNLNFVNFYDDFFPTSEYVYEFCELYKEIGLPFSVNMRPEFVKKETIRCMVDVGLRNVAIGIESGDYEYRKKVLSRNYKNEAVIKAFEIIREHNIRSSSFNMIGLPFETRESIFKTIELNRAAKPSSATICYFYPYRGTTLRDICVKEGFFDPKDEDNIDIGHRTCSALTMPTISKEEVESLYMRFQLYYRLPKIFWPLIKITEKHSSTDNIIFRILMLIFNYYAGKDLVWDFDSVK